MNQRISKQSISLARAIRSSIGCVWASGFAPLAPVHYRIKPLHFTAATDWSDSQVKVDTRLTSPI